MSAPVLDGAGAAATAPARFVAHVMGTAVSLALRGRHTGDGAARDAWAAVVADLRRADALFSPWRANSLVSRIGRGELAPADAGPEMAEVLAIGAAAARGSGGAFTLHPRGRFDPCGVVKGWAVERACTHLRALDDTGWCLAAGGDLQARAADDGEPWRIGIEDPAATGRIVATVPVVDGAVATSGSAHRGAHVVDGRTGATPSGIAQVSVLDASLTRADVDATAAFALGEDGVEWLAHRAGRTALVVRSDGAALTVRGPDPADG
ncbi:FAD:protein FMN transferase [Pseudonocardia spirodelae]|uniref:FAD:protein FMN transferase n=1 Tax=Pseudonocardia spirodelae TaxID=3133431 RepID=A0ABU8TAU1_9PSEU